MSYSLDWQKNKKKKMDITCLWGYGVTEIYIGTTNLEK